MLSVLLRCTDYDYPFGIFKLFLKLSLTIPETTTYDVENLESGLGQVQKGGGVKPVNGNPPPPSPPLLIVGFPSSIQTFKQTIQQNPYRVVSTHVISYFVPFEWLGVRVMVFHATLNNISVISWRSVLLVDETGGPGDNHRPAAS